MKRVVCNNKRDFKDVTIINIINIYYLNKREKGIESVPYIIELTFKNKNPRSGAPLIASI